MNLLLEKIKRVIPAANQRAHGFSDVERIASREKISIIVADYRPDILGYYATRRSKRSLEKFMMINARINSEPEKTFVGLHELGHHFLHAPITWRQPLRCIRSSSLTQSKYDKEADAFALIAMVPLWLLLEMQDTNFANIDPALVPFLIKRQKLWELHGV